MAAFTDKQLEEAIDRVLAGEKLAAVADSSPVSLSTLKRKVAARIEGRSIERQRPGPAPLLPPEFETDLVTCYESSPVAAVGARGGALAHRRRRRRSESVDTALEGGEGRSDEDVIRGQQETGVEEFEWLAE
ncbi:hypothetical protein PHYSODRAFT_328406 [Phytophthora sojae]|uniref:Uncharacterized protein n=1 Tax=Phytophthora sojae (strain P6497) TaxID=1094619 RepID=G4Z5Z5_PHYSP|nr:hypothetical protein PHYSODRAFT_328406 [Phytophthora sojae]EGZ20274.1 hypothetical protein PHYSODRAFT_328406 [Phytophthora sojae]|eukprot:XP_009522991.1 hypothetical protein PHYSODRAFT_328406 [Phytophthora sojae]